MTTDAREVMTQDEFFDFVQGIRNGETDGDELWTLIARLLAENAALRERAEAAERDAERYRWLKQERYQWSPGAAVTEDCQSEPAVLWARSFCNLSSQIDAAIDAAREQEGKT